MSSNGDEEDGASWFVDMKSPASQQDESSGPRQQPAKIRTIKDVLRKRRGEIERRDTPTLWTPDEEPWGNLAFSPGSVCVIGGPGEVGKTALVLDLLIRMLARYPLLRVVIASNDMAIKEIGNRWMANLSGVNLRDIQGNAVAHDQTGKLEAAFELLDRVDDRVQFIERPFTIEQFHAAAVEFRADIAFLDYLQITASAEVRHDSQQQHVARLMLSLRALADFGPCVITTLALSRQGVVHARGRVGRTDANELDMAVFGHAGEIEYMADLGYVLMAESGAQVALKPADEYQPIKTWLQCVKGRNRVKVHVPLLFDGRFQKFTPRNPDEKKNQRKLAAPHSTSGKGKGGVEKPPVVKGADDDGTEWLA